MQKPLLCCLLCILALTRAIASGDPWPVGGRALGIGNTTVTLTDSWALFNNPAGLAGSKQTNILFAFDSRFSVSGLQGIAVGLVHPFKYGNLGLSVQKTGDALYNEHLAGLAYSHKINHVQIGLKANYVQIYISDVGTKAALAMEFGGIATISSQLSFGAHIYNFNQAKLARYQDERLATVMKTGLSYKPISKLMLNLEAQKDINFPAMVKAGIEYELIKNLCVRTGISTKPSMNYFGLGINKKRFQMDYALRIHATLGFSHHLSLGLSFEKKTNPKIKNI